MHGEHFKQKNNFMLQLLITESYLESFIGENYEEQKNGMVKSAQVGK